ncbi:hypothetical protein ACHAWT_003327, partial [Skeletonema menzelii]
THTVQFTSTLVPTHCTVFWFLWCLCTALCTVLCTVYSGCTGICTARQCIKKSIHECWNKYNVGWTVKFVVTWCW